MFAGLTILALFASSAIAKDPIPGLDEKVVITDGYDFGAMDAQLLEYLPTRPYTQSKWSPGYIPAGCKSSTERFDYNPQDLEVYSVKYDDCEDPWVFCRHKDSPVAADDIFTIVSRVPVGMRQYVKNLVAYPRQCDADGDCTYAWTTDGSIVNVWDTHWTIGVLVHEMSHVLDALALRRSIGENEHAGTWFSQTKLWQDAVEKDFAVPSLYAKNSWQEDFADVGRVTMSDMVVPGGLPAINRNSPEVSWQVNTYKMYLRNTIFPDSGRCTAKNPSTDPVPVLDGAKFSPDAFGPVPNTTLSGAVPEIVVPDDVASAVLSGYHGN